MKSRSTGAARRTGALGQMFFLLCFLRMAGGRGTSRLSRVCVGDVCSLTRHYRRKIKCISANCVGQSQLAHWTLLIRESFIALLSSCYEFF